MKITLHMSRLVALAGSILTLVQIFFIANNQDGICLNDGCKVVDSLTAVPPIYFNIGGFLFFQAVFWGLWLVRSNSKWQVNVNILLLAGLAAEGVLVSFQHLVAQTFCSYCLIIFSLILLLNILAGIRQLFTGAAVFFAVLACFMSLQFGGGRAPFLQLDSGTFAALAGDEEEKRYLFFSSTCKYCEQVIESLEKGSNCGVRFNPLDRIDNFPLEAAVRKEDYSPETNIKIMKALGLEQVPVLLITKAAGFEVITGSGKIQQHFDEKCLAPVEAPNSGSTQGTSQSPGLDFLPLQDGSCSVTTDCDDQGNPLPPQ